MNESRTPRVDIGLSVFLIVVCSAVLYELAGFPPGVFEPLGSAPIPRTVAVAIILLCLIVIANAYRGLGKEAAAAVGDETELRPVDAAGIFALTVVYVLVMAFKLVGFATATTIFLLLAIGMLVRFERRAMIVAVIIALLMGFGCEYLFTKIFYVDLPAA